MPAGGDTSKSEGYQRAKAEGRLGRPVKEFDWKAIANMCKIHCTMYEIYHIVDADQTTLNDACKRDCLMDFPAFYAKHCAGGKKSLRRAQWHKALSGSATMQIWLGKQWLDQKDKPVNEDEEDGGFTLNYKDD